MRIPKTVATVDGTGKEGVFWEFGSSTGNGERREREEKHYGAHRLIAHQAFITRPTRSYPVERRGGVG